jgi:hypothetical protein
MTQKQNIKFLLVAALVAVSAGGWLLHLRIHPPFSLAQHLIPFIAGIISIAVIPALFLSKKSLAYAYVVNGMIVIIGVITMAHFSMMNPPKHITVWTIIVGTLFADIAVLFTKFFLGKALFEIEMLKTIDAQVRHGRFWRYPNMGWWGVHFLALSLVYVMGNLLWK